MADDRPDDNNEAQPQSRVDYVMRRVLGPAVAMVILVAAIVVMPALLAGDPPPIGGGAMLGVFLGSLAFFTGLALWLDRKGAPKDGS